MGRLERKDEIKNRNVEGTDEINDRKVAGNVCGKEWEGWRKLMFTCFTDLPYRIALAVRARIRNNWLSVGSHAPRSSLRQYIDIRYSDEAQKLLFYETGVKIGAVSGKPEQVKYNSWRVKGIHEGSEGPIEFQG